MKARKRVGIEHGSVVVVVFGGGIFLSGNFAFCFDRVGFCRGGGVFQIWGRRVLWSFELQYFFLSLIQFSYDLGLFAK